MNRRQFFIATASVVATGCGSMDSTNDTATPHGARVINAGPVGRYGADGVYDAFGDEGFFILSQKGKLTILSAICTHRRCKLKAEPDHSFYCQCHGSIFDPEGNVLIGPAKRRLPVLSSTINNQQELIVTVPDS